MPKKHIIWLLIFLLTIVKTKTIAQNAPQYKYDMGVAFGTMAYLGDFNANFIKGMQPMGAIVARRCFNPHVAIKAEAAIGKIKGSSKNINTVYPELNTKEYKFDNMLTDITIAGEYNFWPYGTGEEYRGAKKITPYILGGIATTIVPTNKKNIVAANVVLGIGVKYKLTERLNIAAEWTAHITTTDKLDAKEDPYIIRTRGILKNKDAYHIAQVMITYSFAPKCRTCNKDI